MSRTTSTGSHADRGGCGDVRAEAEQAAWLHDIVDDTEMSVSGLTERGFARDVVVAVDAVTRRQDETYD